MKNAKARIPVIAALVMAFAAPLPLRAGDIELRGVDKDGETTFLSLKNTRTGASAWVKVKGRFDGYTVTSFDPAKNTAKLEHEGETITVSLSAATIAKPPELTEEQREEIKKKVLNNLRQLSAAADQYYLENGVSETKIELLVGKTPDKYIKELKAADGEDYTKVELKQGKPLKVKTAGGVEVSYDN